MAKYLYIQHDNEIYRKDDAFVPMDSTLICTIHDATLEEVEAILGGLRSFVFTNRDPNEDCSTPSDLLTGHTVGGV